ncbi:hypothetical protein [Nonomuraea africana]|uniref:Uncharacterized protein n=1 Tax=Nonomuraea africana TaxID=46171 RepID=A0ABR9K9T2_9ACTN|nr:hypothetical protein [Nonomuraea africana]MBE1558772.1 hypothetical protein [Nonomuraea africana]
MFYFGLGLLLGASTVAFVAGVLGGVVQALVPASVRLGALALLAAAVLARETGLVSFRVPENRRLVPEHVLNKGRVVGGMQFGFEMGTGMRTYSPSAQPHLVLAAMVLALPFGGTLAAGVGFGLARWAMAAASMAHSDDGSWTAAWHRNQRPLAVATAVATIGSLALGLVMSA